VDRSRFERAVLEAWQAIPDRFRVGVAALEIHDGLGDWDGAPDPTLLGLCEPDPVVSELSEDVVSRIHIFYGGFVHAAALGPFDWAAEVTETVRHELQHHLEWRAGVDPLGESEDVEMAHYARLDGQPFHPGYHRGGVPMAPDAWLVADELYVERWVSRRQWRSCPVAASWQGVKLTLVPQRLADGIAYVAALADGWVPAAGVTLVLRRRFVGKSSTDLRWAQSGARPS